MAIRALDLCPQTLSDKLMFALHIIFECNEIQSESIVDTKRHNLHHRA